MKKQKYLLQSFLLFSFLMLIGFSSSAQRTYNVTPVTKSVDQTDLIIATLDSGGTIEDSFIPAPPSARKKLIGAYQTVTSTSIEDSDLDALLIPSSSNVSKWTNVKNEITDQSMKDYIGVLIDKLNSGL